MGAPAPNRAVIESWTPQSAFCGLSLLPVTPGRSAGACGYGWIVGGGDAEAETALA